MLGDHLRVRVFLLQPHTISILHHIYSIRYDVVYHAIVEETLAGFLQQYYMHACIVWLRIRLVYYDGFNDTNILNQDKMLPRPHFLK